MANGHSIVPTDHEYLLTNAEFREELEQLHVYIPANLPHGRFPTLSQLRGIIQQLGFELEESGDWWVTSKDDYTHIWFKTEDRQENSVVEFWCRRGGIIVLDIVQMIANQQGSFLVTDQSGAITILLAPIQVLSENLQPSGQNGFIAEMRYRIPVMLDLLEKSPPDTTFLFLSQMYRTLFTLDHYREYELFPLAQQGMALYTTLIDNPDTRIHKVASALIELLQKEA
jgi:hypothetical protein